MREGWISQRIVTPEGVRPGVVMADNGRIAEVRADVPEGVATVHDWGSDALLPGLVDAHTHINEPGRTEWEGFATATRAAAAGGFTTVIDMPLNCLPETTTVEALEAKRAAAAGKCMVDWAAWGGAVGFGNRNGNEEHLLPLARAGVAGYKCFLVYPGCEGFTEIDLDHLERAAPLLQQSGLPLLVHAELAGPIDAACARIAEEGSDWHSYATYLASRPDEAETEAIAALLNLCRRYRFRLHIVHLATAHALPMLRAAKAEGLPLTVETCPHYLYFAAEEIADSSTQHKCAPPIRSRENREMLWEALREGVIDMVATDHSPCPPEMKLAGGGRFDQAWGGIASLSTALSAMWTEAAARGFLLSDVVRWMSSAPAQMAGLEKRVGAVAAGHDANFVRFDMEAEWRVTEGDLHHRHKVSPYVGEALRGRVRSTVLRGRVVFEEGGFPADALGEEYRLPIR